jgi:hypothetical protein
MVQGVGKTMRYRIAIPDACFIIEQNTESRFAGAVEQKLTQREIEPQLTSEVALG